MVGSMVPIGSPLHKNLQNFVVLISEPLTTKKYTAKNFLNFVT